MLKVGYNISIPQLNMRVYDSTNNNFLRTVLMQVGTLTYTYN
jgi:hypothetical protein